MNIDNYPSFKSNYTNVYFYEMKIPLSQTSIKSAANAFKDVLHYSVLLKIMLFSAHNLALILEAGLFQAFFASFATSMKNSFSVQRF